MSVKTILNPFTGTLQKIVDEDSLPSAGTIDFVENDLTYQVDGITDTFTLLQTAISSTMAVHLNGIKLIKGIGKDFTELNTTQFKINGDIVRVGETLVVQYIK